MASAGIDYHESDTDTDSNYADVNTDDVIQQAIQNDPELNHIINKLDRELTLDPDHDLNIEDDASSQTDFDSVSTSSSLKENDHEHEHQRNGNHDPDKNSIASSSSVTSSTSRQSSSLPQRDSPSRGSVMSQGSVSSTGDKKSSGISKSRGSSLMKPFQALKKLTKFDKDEKKKKQMSFKSAFSAVIVDRLPQVFVVKYLGHREVSGIFGLHRVRKPVDEMVKAVKKDMETAPKMELPLMYMVVSHKGLDLREHKNNKIKDAFPAGLIPIDFISYGVQDIKFWRVFTCIVVRELSSRSRSATCHGFLCDSPYSGRKIALSLGAAFNVYSKKLKSDGKTHNFQVELRPPDELATAVDAECEA